MHLWRFRVCGNQLSLREKKPVFGWTRCINLFRPDLHLHIVLHLVLQLLLRVLARFCEQAYIIHGRRAHLVQVRSRPAENGVQVPSSRERVGQVHEGATADRCQYSQFLPWRRRGWVDGRTLGPRRCLCRDEQRCPVSRSSSLLGERDFSASATGRMVGPDGPDPHAASDIRGRQQLTIRGEGQPRDGTLMPFRSVGYRPPGSDLQGLRPNQTTLSIQGHRQQSFVGEKTEVKGWLSEIHGV